MVIMLWVVVSLKIVKHFSGFVIQYFVVQTFGEPSKVCATEFWGHSKVLYDRCWGVFGGGFVVQTFRTLPELIIQMIQIKQNTNDTNLQERV